MLNPNIAGADASSTPAPELLIMDLETLDDQRTTAF